MDPLTSTMVARAHFWPRLRRRTSSSKTSIGTIVSTMSGSTALRLMAEVEAPAEDELDDQMIRCARQANADAAIELPFRAHIQVKCAEDLVLLLADGIESGHRTQRPVIFKSYVHFLSDIEARLHVRGEHDARRHARPVKRTINSRIECQIPTTQLLVDDRPDLQRPGVGGVLRPLIAEFE